MLMKTARGLLFVAVLIVIYSCKDGMDSTLPKSSGRPYEVLIASNNRMAGMIADSVLTIDAACLPQPEPEFDTSLTDSAHLNPVTRLARNIVIVNVNPDVFTRTSIQYDKNVWARRQIVVYINTSDAETLRRDMRSLGHKLVGLLVRSEMNNAIRNLETSRNLKADSMVEAVAGRKMRIPTDMTSSKCGNGFIWLSNNAAQGMSNICVYTYKGLDLSQSHFVRMRDSIMRRNMPGEEDGMYMQTVQNTVVSNIERVKKRSVTIVRGLWEMRNDAMGGPFVAHLTADTINNKVIVAEAFVYAPETKKRNLIRQAEAALYTMK